MKKTITKIVAFLLTALLLITVLPLSVFADMTAEYKTGHGYEYCIVDNSYVSINNFANQVTGKVVIPSTLDGYPVKEVSLGGYNQKVTSVTIPDCVEKLWSFPCNDGMKTVYIGNNVNYIGDSAFSGAHDLVTINVAPENEYFVSVDGVLYNKDMTTLVRYPQNKAAKVFIIPDSITEIGRAAFDQCNNLTNIIIPDGVEKIGVLAFSSCESLQQIDVPNSVKYIGGQAFDGCIELDTFSLSSELEYLGENAFHATEYSMNFTADGSNPPSANWKNGMLYVTNWLVETNKNVPSNLVIPEGTLGMVSGGLNHYADGSRVTSVSIPGSVKTIPNNTFSGETYINSLKTASMGYGVKIIDERAFADCAKLESVSIPASVTEIKDYAFTGCMKLASVTLPAAVSQIGCGTFYCAQYGYYTVDGVDHPEVLGQLSDIYIYNQNCDIYDRYDTISSNTVIHGYAGSTAQAYAEKYNRTFVELSECSHAQTELMGNCAATCCRDGYSGDVICKICGAVVTAGTALRNRPGHDYGEWRLADQATFLEYGVERRTCKNCGIAEKRVLPVVTPSEIDTNSESGISISYSDGTLDNNATLSVSEKTSGNSYKILSNNSDITRFELYDISVKKSGLTVQPDGNVLVKIPVSNVFDPDNLAVYHITSSGKTEDLRFYYFDGYVYFETTHFSDYAVVEEVGSGINIQVEPKLTFFQKLINFFSRIFAFFANLFA